MASLPYDNRDPNKIFVGSLEPWVNKPHLISLCQQYGFGNDKVFDIFVPEGKPNKKKIGFIVFFTIPDTLNALQWWNGLQLEIAPSGLVAHRGL